MNYFELFQLPYSLNINYNILKKKYYVLCATHHPDKFSGSDNGVQATALEKTAEINKAYKVLSNKDLLFKYILELQNIISIDEEYKLSPDFLMEMMAINEQVMEAKLANDTLILEKVKHAIIEEKAKLDSDIEWFFDLENLSIINDKNKAQLKAYYYKSKYIKRLQQLVAGNEAEM